MRLGTVLLPPCPFATKSRDQTISSKTNAEVSNRGWRHARPKDFIHRQFHDSEVDQQHCLPLYSLPGSMFHCVICNSQTRRNLPDREESRAQLQPSIPWHSGSTEKLSGRCQNGRVRTLVTPCCTWSNLQTWRVSTMKVPYVMCLLLMVLPVCATAVP